MAAFLSANLANIIVLALVILMVALAVRSLVINKKKGVHSCGYNCPGCSAGSCGGCADASVKRK